MNAFSGGGEGCSTPDDLRNRQSGDIENNDV